MAKCKSCKIDLSKVKNDYSYPKGIPISKEMKDTIEKLRRDKNASGSKRR